MSALAPVLGSFIGILFYPSKSLTADMLAFAAGIMLGISFLELIPFSLQISGLIICVLGFLVGSLLMYLLDRILPHIHPELSSNEPGKQLKKTALFLIIGIFLHNFPEGMAIAVGSVAGVRISLAVAVGIAIHNIPEGICTSAPYYYCTKKRLKSFLLSSITAIPVVLGFLTGRLLYSLDLSALSSFIASLTAGFMIYISADQLIPSAFNLSYRHDTIFSFIGGIVLVLLLMTI
ncbi:MAG: ZIP family metal transporter [Candidatus Woesearchaeota archaeon]